jgi:hypothetical protein
MMKSILEKLSLISLLTALSIGGAVADSIQPMCPELSKIQIDTGTFRNDRDGAGNWIGYKIQQPQGSGWLVRHLIKKESGDHQLYWDFSDVRFFDNNIDDSVVAMNKAVQIIQSVNQGTNVSVLRKHYFNPNRTGAYFYTCAYPISSEYAKEGASLTATSILFDDVSVYGSENTASRMSESVAYDLKYCAEGLRSCMTPP